MNISLLFARRYFLFKNSAHIVNLISWISIVAISICTAGLIIILSVFNGLSSVIKNLHNSYDSDIKIYSKYGKTLEINSSIINFLNSRKNILTYSLVSELDAVVQRGENQFIIKIKGIDSNFADKKFKEKFLKRGNFIYPNHYNNNFILISKYIAQSLGIDMDQSLNEIGVYTAPIKIKSINLEDLLNFSYFYTIGEYSIHKEVDSKYCFAPIDIVKKLSELNENQISSIEIYFDSSEINKIGKIKNELFETFKNQKVNIETKVEQNKTILALLQMEKTSIFLILSFIIIIAAFNIAGAVNLLIMEKQKHIYMLISFGYDRNKIKKIFSYSGILHGLIGVISGLLLGGFICLLQIKFHIIKIKNENFIINYFPVKFELFDVMLTFGIVMSICFIATKYAIYKLHKKMILSSLAK